MKRNFLISFLLTVIMFIILQWQGKALITPQSPGGILDFEFAKTQEHFYHLQLFWNADTVLQSIYLHFLLIAAYGWFLFTACKVVNNTKSNLFSELAISACAFDVLENFLMILVITHRFSSSVLQIVFYCAILKFSLIALVIVYLILSLFSLFKEKTSD